jgi:hypothetical protein
MPRRRLRGAILAVLLALALLAPASAGAAVGTPIALGPGENANVTVEADGTAHLVWRGQGVDSPRLTYCRLRVSDSACTPQTAITAPGDNLLRPLAFGNGGTVRVISYRYGGDVQTTYGTFGAVLMWTSTDDGASFGAPIQIGADMGPVDYAFGPGDNVSAVTSAATVCGMCFRAWPLSGGNGAGITLSSTHPYNGTVALLDANTPLVVMQAGNGDTQFRRFSGNGDVNDVANWLPAVDIGPHDYPHLASGPSGMFLIAGDQLSGSIVQARRFDGTTFGNRVQVTSGTRADHVSQDGLGRLHVVGGRFDAGPTGAAIFYGSSDDGARWATQDVVFPGLPSDMRVAVAPDHFGVVVGRYATGPGGMFAARIGPSAEVPATARFVDATLVSGTVLIRAPGSNRFVQLRRGDVIPVGSVVDAKGGRVRITIAVPGGGLQSTDFFEGVFRVTQARNGVATMVLTGGSFRSCGRGRGASASQSKKKIRHLWGDGKGKFRTKGRYAAAALRGTRWDTIDRCDGTLVRVTVGRVVVTDLVRRRTVVVRAGRQYLARARR